MNLCVESYAILFKSGTIWIRPKSHDALELTHFSDWNVYWCTIRAHELKVDS